MKNKIDLLTNFATPIWLMRLKNVSSLNKELLNFFYEQKKINPKGIERSSLFGWHSQDYVGGEIYKIKPYKNFFERIAPLVQRVSDDMGWDRKNYTPSITSTWGIINPPYASNWSHIHHNNIVSAAYYVQWPTNGGGFVAQDPRNDALYYRPSYKEVKPLNVQQVTIEPQTGLIEMFPSYLRHRVEPNMSKKDRVIISFNINLIPLKN